MAMSVDVLEEEFVLSVEQVRSLLEWVRGQADGDRSVYPFLLTVAEQALCPQEARRLRVRDLVLPNEGWGEVVVPRRGGGRAVPLQPRSVEFLRGWIVEAGLQKDDLLFPGTRGGLLSVPAYQRLWERAQEAVMPRDDLFRWRQGEPVAILRESCLVEWLRLGFSAFTVAEWADVNPSWLAQRYPYRFRLQDCGIDWDHLAEVTVLPGAIDS